MRNPFSRRVGRVLLAAAILSSASLAAYATETTTFSYDPLGRLVGSSTSGSVNNGMTTGTSHDGAGNRVAYCVRTTTANPCFGITSPQVMEGGNLVFQVTRTPTTSSYTINYATANGTASSSSDYTATSGTLTFSASETVKTVTVATGSDSSVESNETVLVNLSSASGSASIAVSQGVGTILNDD